MRPKRDAFIPAVVVLSFAVAISDGLAQVDTAALVTGGGTVLAAPLDPNTVASFGLNARRPAGFTGGGAAQGRINYDKHAMASGRHVNVPVVLMEAVITPNGTGGQASLVGDCTAPGAECPTGTKS